MLNQVEIDIERHVLTQTKKLSDNKFEKIFTRNDRNEFGMFTYNCHLCSVPCLTGERALQTHITGKKHQQRLVYDYVPDAETFKATLAPKTKPLAIVFPGEPAPPGYEDEVNTISHLESVANKQTKPLIGLEYVVELIDNKAKEPFYVCTLCDKRCDPRNILPQITSHRHRMKYLENHFNKVMTALNLNHKFNVDMHYREEVLCSIAEKLERRFKRTKPHVCEYRDFERNKSEITEQIRAKKHHSENDWPDCEKFLLENLKPTASPEFESVSSESESELNDIRRPHAMVSSRSRNVRKSRSRSPSTKFSNAFSKQQQPTKRENSSEHRKILTPRELSEQSNAKMQEKYILEKFKASVEIAVKAEEKKFKDFEKNPEKHPFYSEEWKAFWSRRYKELIAQNKDAPGHDYKPEWIEFWTKRMKDLHRSNIEKIKTDFRKKLGLSAEAVKRIENSPSNLRSRVSRSRSPRNQRVRQRSESPIKISDDSDDDRSRRSNGNRAKKYRVEPSRQSEERSHSRFSESSSFSRHSDHRSKEAYESSYYQSRNRDQERNFRSKSPDIIDDGPVNVISVCRLLSALESELGLMAKSILDLLAQAVAIEKLKPNSADELLLNTENCNVLETVKEKLKGILTANLLGSNKTIAVKRAIQNIATLLHDISKRKPSTSNAHILRKFSGSNRENTDPEPLDGVDPVASAKLEIAKVITASLLEQGRCDVSAEELEALVESFMDSAVAEDQEAEEEKAPIVMKPVNPIKIELRASSSSFKKPVETSSSGLENLTDEDLQTLLRNFADLTSDEQSHLIAYLSKIEQTNPTRVEKLRKYVNIGDNDDNDVDFEERKEDMNIDMDIAAGVSEPMSTVVRRKSPEPMKQDLSDDDYDDDAMAKKLGQSGEISKGNSISIATTPSNTLKDNMGLADDLMSSLMQSSRPPQVNNGWGMEMHNTFYNQTPMHPYPDIMPMYAQQMNMPMNMGVQPHFNQQMNMAQPSGAWPQSAASNFFQKGAIPTEFSSGSNQEKVPYRLRAQNINNRQLTGKGKQRR